MSARVDFVMPVRNEGPNIARALAEQIGRAHV